MRLHTSNSLGIFIFQEGHFFLSQNSQILQNLFAYSFELTERLGIQISQSVKTIVDTNKGQHKADILLIGVSR